MFVSVEKPRPSVRVIRLNRPERLNALSFEVVEPLYEAFRSVASDNECQVVILTGAGRGFCSGLDLKEFNIDRWKLMVTYKTAFYSFYLSVALPMV